MLDDSIIYEGPGTNLPHILGKLAFYLRLHPKYSAKTSRMLFYLKRDYNICMLSLDGLLYKKKCPPRFHTGRRQNFMWSKQGLLESSML